MNQPIERRNIAITPELPVSLEQREESEGLPKIVGYSAVFGVDTEIKSWFGSFKERLQKGAFRRAIREAQDVRALRNHDPDNLLGKISAKTLRLKEDDTGLFIEVDPPETSTGRDTVELVRRGDLSGMSFAFIVRKEKWINGENGDPDLRIIQDVDLYDVGPVTFPAYASTSADLRSSSLAYQVGLAELGRPVPRLPQERSEDEPKAKEVLPEADPELDEPSDPVDDEEKAKQDSLVTEEAPAVDEPKEDPTSDSEEEKKSYKSRLRLVRAQKENLDSFFLIDAKR